MPFHHPHLKQFEFRHPGPLAVATIRNWRGRRHMPLSNLVIPQTGVCKWCNVVKVKGKRHYCDHDCANSAYAFCYPQSPEAKGFVFLDLQSCTCTACGEIFEDTIREMIEQEYARIAKWQADKGLQAEPISYYLLMANTGEQWHVDHVIPISRGGDGIGFENVQVICKVCHLKKTARENLGIPVVNN